VSRTDSDLLLFLSPGCNLYICSPGGVCENILSNNTSVVDISSIDKLSDRKFDLIMSPYTLNIAIIKQLVDLLADNGQIVFRIQNTNLLSIILARLNICICKVLLKCLGFTTVYFSYLSPGFDSTVQVVSSCKVLSQQYFRQHYDWSYTTQQSLIKRLIKYFVFKTNTFYLLEKSCILGFQKC